MGRTFEICEVCKEEMQALWAVEVGRTTFHMWSNLSELYRLRETVDEMIKGLEDIQKEKSKEAEEREKKRMVELTQDQKASAIVLLAILIYWLIVFCYYWHKYKRSK